MKPFPGSPDAMFARNRWTFSVGTLGRDMVYTLVSLYLIVYLTEVLNATDTFMWWAGWLILAARLFDAVMDIVMGSIVDNTRSRWGHYKPWIAGGAVASAACTLMLIHGPGSAGRRVRRRLRPALPSVGPDLDDERHSLLVAAARTDVGPETA